MARGRKRPALRDHANQRRWNGAIRKSGIWCCHGLQTRRHKSCGREYAYDSLARLNRGARPAREYRQRWLCRRKQPERTDPPPPSAAKHTATVTTTSATGKPRGKTRKKRPPGATGLNQQYTRHQARRSRVFEPVYDADSNQTLIRHPPESGKSPLQRGKPPGALRQ